MTNLLTPRLGAAKGKHHERAQICIRHQGAEEDHTEAIECSQRFHTEPVDAEPEPAWSSFKIRRSK